MNTPTTPEPPEGCEIYDPKLAAKHGAVKGMMCYQSDQGWIPSKYSPGEKIKGWDLTHGEPYAVPLGTTAMLTTPVPVRECDCKFRPAHDTGCECLDCWRWVNRPHFSECPAHPRNRYVPVLPGQLARCPKMPLGLICRWREESSYTNCEWKAYPEGQWPFTELSCLDADIAYAVPAYVMAEIEREEVLTKGGDCNDSGQTPGSDTAAPEPSDPALAAATCSKPSLESIRKGYRQVGICPDCGQMAMDCLCVAPAPVEPTPPAPSLPELGATLLPCPFCGYAAEFAETHRGHWKAMCSIDECHISISGPSKEEAAGKWNTRSAPPSAVPWTFPPLDPAQFPPPTFTPPKPGIWEVTETGMRMISSAAPTGEEWMHLVVEEAYAAFTISRFQPDKMLAILQRHHQPSAEVAGLKAELDEVKTILKSALDRDGAKDIAVTPVQFAALASNGIHWRDTELTQLRESLRYERAQMQLYPQVVDENEKLRTELAQLREERDILSRELDDLRTWSREMRKQELSRLESDSPVAACNCLTKSPDIQYHKPGCKYRLIAERDQLRETVREQQDTIGKLSAEVQVWRVNS